MSKLTYKDEILSIARKNLISDTKTDSHSKRFEDYYVDPILEKVIKIINDRTPNRELITSFMVFFDGCGDYIDPMVNVSTFQMGLCDLTEINGGIKVTLRRPGLLIGKGGRTINALKEFLDCEVEIEEKNFG